MMDDVLRLLSASSDVFTIAMCIALYRLDKRLSRLELFHEWSAKK